MYTLGLVVMMDFALPSMMFGRRTWLIYAFRVKNSVLRFAPTAMKSYALIVPMHRNAAIVMLYTAGAAKKLMDLQAW